MMKSLKIDEKVNFMIQLFYSNMLCPVKFGCF